MTGSESTIVNVDLLGKIFRRFLFQLDLLQSLIFFLTPLKDFQLNELIDNELEHEANCGLCCH